MFEVSSQCTGRFQMIPFKNRLVSDYLSLYLNVSVQDCGGQCARTSNCDSFSYQPKTNPSECYLYRKRVWAGKTPAVNKEGLVTYWRLADHCPSEYILNTVYNTCFKAYINTGDETTWSRAMTRCEEDGGYLFIASSMNRLQMVTDFVKNLKVYGQLTYVGGNDVYVKGTWEWIDGSTEFIWGLTEPNVFEEHCGAVKTQNPVDGLRDVHCDSLYGYLCEIPI
ncbi:hypothetical protein SNE40_020844 [Patella caerulea]|uniref:C-type lectin n=1 Tax=Patella caerulea TaxID=87958 RepID=A0AAN8J518_PATCE